MLPLHDWIQQILADPHLTGMGHAQQPATANIGLGWLYYSLARIVQPATAVAIGSHRGFAPMMIARALAENSSAARLIFIDPSLVDPFWRNAAAVQAHFAQFGLTNIEHHCLTTQDFVQTENYRAFKNVEFIFVDGFHSAEQARFDYEAFARFLTPRGMALFHDSIRIRLSRIYGADKAYEHRVREYMDELRKDPQLQVFDVPYGDGLTLVRKAGQSEVVFTLP